MTGFLSPFLELFGLKIFRVKLFPKMNLKKRICDFDFFKKKKKKKKEFFLPILALFVSV